MITHDRPSRTARLRAVGVAPTVLTAALAAGLLAAPGAPAVLGDVQLVATGTIDITDTPGTVTDQYGTSGAEGVQKLIDNTPYYSKYFTQHPTGWIQFAADTEAKATSYAITSANDSSDRNPKSWVFEASTTGNANSWVTLDTRTNQSFVAFWARKTYSFTNNNNYRYYRLRVTANNGSPDLQLAELQIYGTTTANPPAPPTPTGVTATPRSGDQILLSWNDVSRYETSYRIERSFSPSGGWALLATVGAGNTKYADLKLSGNTHYYYRVRAENTANSAWATADATTPNSWAPGTWTETWHRDGKDETVTKIYDNSKFVLYRDAGLAGTNLTWVQNFLAPIWEYVSSNYANLSGQRLNASLHDSTGAGGFAVNVFDDFSQYTDTIDLTGYTWANDTGNRDRLSHEVGHIVEGAGFGYHLSPGISIWGDSKWCEIFQYDVYLKTGNTADATRWYNEKINTVDNDPAPNTHWFRDWFYPIYNNYGGAPTLNKFFQLVSQHYHRINSEYPRNMNWGEFVHFWSGAAGVNLKPLATSAFGWPSSWEAEFQQAKLDFPGVTYTP